VKVFPERLPEQLARGIKPVYLISGPERLLVEEAADQIRAACRKQGIEERIRLSADGRFSWNDLARATETGSLFATRRLVELRLPTGKPGAEGGKVIRAWLDQGRDDVLLILCDQWEFSQEKAAWVKAIEKTGIYMPAWGVKPPQLPACIAHRLKSRGLVSDSSICQFLAERLEGNLLAAAQEVERLAMLFPGRKLGLDQVRAAVADNARFDSFRLVELVLDGQAGAALRCIRGLREADTPPPQILWALGRELEIASLVARRAGQQPIERIFSDLNVWRSRQQAIQTCIHRNGARRLDRAVGRLTRLDLLSKGQRTDGNFWLELESLCVQVASTPGRGA